MKKLTKAFLCTCLISTLALSAFAQGTAFTYQGRLNGANPANGIYDLRFEIYDAASGAGAQGRPVTNSATSISNGLFTVTLDFGAGVFPGANRWLEIGVRTSGPGAFTPLVPRQPITATPYAIRAGLVTGPINGALILAGTVTGTQLAAGAAASNLQASGQSIVPSGGIILSSNSNDGSLANAGYVKLGKMDLGNSWTAVTTNGAPVTRFVHTAVWTGSEMIVWGGYNGSSYFNDTFSYTPGRVLYLYQRP